MGLWQLDPSGDGMVHLASGGGPQRWMVGEWKTVDLAASQTNKVINRATGQSTAVLLQRNCKVIGFTVNMSNLGTAQPAAGSAMQVRIVRQPAAGGAADASVLLGTVDVGETNVSKAAATEVAFVAGDLCYAVVTTDGSWTSITADPAIALEFEAT